VSDGIKKEKVAEYFSLSCPVQKVVGSGRWYTRHRICQFAGYIKYKP